MIKLIISVNIVFFSVWTFFTSPKEKPKPVSSMPMCNTMQTDGINQWTGTTYLSEFKSVKTTPSVFS